MSNKKVLTDNIIESYRAVSEKHESLDNSGFFNLGFWDPHTANLTTASTQLVHEVLRPVNHPPQNILDVACGEGGTTAALSKSFPEASVTAINISPDQIEKARRRAPHCKFLTMDAAELAFGDNSFDCIVCIEAAFHFHTRATFLREAFRVLKPGGFLVMTDIIFNRRKPTPRIPEENHIHNIAEYHGLLCQAGFTDVVVRDERSKTVAAFNEFMLAERLALALTIPPDPSKLRELASAILECTEWHVTIDHYLLVSARSPAVHSA